MAVEGENDDLEAQMIRVQSPKHDANADTEGSKAKRRGSHASNDESQIPPDRILKTGRRGEP